MTTRFKSKKPSWWLTTDHHWINFYGVVLHGHACRMVITPCWLLSWTKARKKGRISLSEIRSSSKEILQLVQRQAFSEEIDSLSEARPVKCQSKLANLLRLLTEGTLRVGGIIRHTSITLEAAHRTLLPNDHPVPSLPWNPGSRRSWTCSFHQTSSDVWIIQARTLLHHVLWKCIDYRERNEAPMKQLIADMPKEHLTPYDQPVYLYGSWFLSTILRDAWSRQG